MTRQAFLEQLQHHLADLDRKTVEEIVGDYENFFSEAAADGRSETEVVANLGDPKRLAAELRAEASFARWEVQRDPNSGAAALIAPFRLGGFEAVALTTGLIIVGVIVLGFFKLICTAALAGALGLFISLQAWPPNWSSLGVSVMLIAAAVGGCWLIGWILGRSVTAAIWFGRERYQSRSRAAGELMRRTTVPSNTRRTAVLIALVLMAVCTLLAFAGLVLAASV